jgi:phosphoglucomutase
MTAVLGQDPGQRYRSLEGRFGTSVYERIDAPATAEQKAVLRKLTPEGIRVQDLAGEPILSVLTRAPGNDAPIGGLKVVAANGWFAARPSGTEDVYKIYAESFLGREHLRRIQTEAGAIVDQAFRSAGAL